MSVLPTDSLSQPHSRSAGNGKKSGGGGNSLRWITIGSSLCVLVMLFLAYLRATIVSGTELNPNTWQMRGFSFQRDPFTGLQLTGVRHDYTLPIPVWPNVQPFLKDAKSKPEVPRWDLVKISNSLTGARSDGPASILCKYLLSRGSSPNLFWDNWAKKAPKKASILWPAVQDLVRLEAYSDLPSLFDKSFLEVSDGEFQRLIHAAMLALLRDRALRLERDSELSRAIQTARVGLDYGDDDELSRIANLVGTLGLAKPRQ